MISVTTSQWASYALSAVLVVVAAFVESHSSWLAVSLVAAAVMVLLLSVYQFYVREFWPMDSAPTILTRMQRYADEVKVATAGVDALAAALLVAAASTDASDATETRTRSQRPTVAHIPAEMYPEVLRALHDALVRHPNSRRIAKGTCVAVRSIFSTTPRPSNEILPAGMWQSLVECASANVGRDAECCEKAVVALGCVIESPEDDVRPSSADCRHAVAAIIKAWTLHLPSTDTRQFNLPSTQPASVPTWCMWSLLHFLSTERPDSLVKSTVELLLGVDLRALILNTLRVVSDEANALHLLLLLCSLVARSNPSFVGTILADSELLTALKLAVGAHARDIKLYQLGQQLISAIERSRAE